MLQYAQIDAHYLLYIASCLIAELKEQDDGKVCITYFSAIFILHLLCCLEPKNMKDFTSNALILRVLFWRWEIA